MNTKDYINNVVLECFKGAITKPIISVIYDLDGNILIATDLFANRVGFATHQQVIGKKIDDLVYSKMHNRAINQAINDVRQMVISEQRIIHYVSFVHHADGFHAHHVVHEPLFSPDGLEVVATKSVSDKYRHISILDYIQGRFKTITSCMKNQISLTKRQHEILFLLMHGFNQSNVADILNLARGSVSRVIIRLCEKFEISGQSAVCLIEKAKGLGFYHKIPDSLLIPKVIILDGGEDFITSYE